MLKNKHLTAALLVAPMLAVIAYFATDYLVSEKPAAAISGANYKLSAKPDCRYASGKCTLKNHDIELEITFPEKNAIKIQANISLHSAQIKVVSPTPQPQNSERIELVNTDQQKMQWFSTLPNQVETQQFLQVVIDTGDIRLFQEVKMTFINAESQLTR